MSENTPRHDRTVTVDVQFTLGVTERADAPEAPTDDDYEAWLANKLADLQHNRGPVEHPAIDRIEIEEIAPGPTIRHTPGAQY